ncbi:MAG TPA: DNA topoisomerase (ATP-hydrolyzing) subunit B [Candidatus Bipolaricaulota bacterium]|nr:DNA topoisomerase (ATP-hydrolyzing) subunit B [Candidatus Bipolaricaulota bacterium]
MPLKKPPVKTKNDNQKISYTAEQITVLEGLDPVRKRPGMYIGNTSSEGLHHLIWEVVDNSIDEAMAGYCDHIIVRILPDNMIEVTDNGRGIPVDIHKQTKKSALETVMTVLHAGGKFGQGGYKVSGGLHGVGVSVVNALSKWTKAEVKRDGYLYEQEYKIGKPQKNVKKVGAINKPSKMDPLDPGESFDHGTRITFQPDDTIFTETEFKWEKILSHLRQQAFLTKGVKLTIIDIKDKKNPGLYNFYFEGGIATYVKMLNRNDESKHENIFYVNKTMDEIDVEIALRYTAEYQETVLAFTNNIQNPEGGTHLIGFKTGLTRTLNSYARKHNILKEKDENLTGEDTREGLTAIINVKIKDPQFEGQTKAKLGNAEVRPAVDTVLSEALETFLEEHPRDAEAIIGKALLAAQARRASRAARETVLRKGVLDGFALPGKLADCSSRKAENCEIFIVEGDSAGGSAKQGRNREFQAILPLRGKIINVEKARLDKILANTEIKAMIIAMGTNVGEQFDIEKLRYNKIVIMTDADVDGAHIRTLLLTLFYRYFPELITKGHIFIAQPPLFSIKRGKEMVYVYTEQEKDAAISRMAKTKVTSKIKETPVAEDSSINEQGLTIQRYKGLGEMNPDQLWQTTMDPETRFMKQVMIEDAEKADEIFDILMGSEVGPRKKFIQTHAKSVENLDI